MILIHLFLQRLQYIRAQILRALLEGDIKGYSEFEQPHRAHF